MDEARIIEIESKVLFQENLLEDLHQVLYAQQKIIDTLQSQLNLLTKRVEAVAEGGLEIGGGNVKPPHY